MGIALLILAPLLASFGVTLGVFALSGSAARAVMRGRTLTRKDCIFRVVSSLALFSLEYWREPRLPWLFAALVVGTLTMAALYWPLTSRRCSGATDPGHRS